MALWPPLWANQRGAGQNPDVLLALRHTSSSVLHGQAPFSSGHGAWSNGKQVLCASSAVVREERTAAAAGRVLV